MWKKIIVFVLVAVSSFSCNVKSSLDEQLEVVGLATWSWGAPLQKRMLRGIVDKSGVIIIPPHVDDIMVKKGVVFGHKVPCERPADWMSDDWNKDGWFIVKNGKLEWFSTKDEYKKALDRTKD